MIPFRLSFRPGVPISDQVVYAAKKAIVSGQLPAGAKFPSVRELSKELKINPNTAHKVIAELTAQGLLEVLPGIGTTVASPRSTTAVERNHLLGPQLERFVVEAKKVGLELDEVLAAVGSHWEALRENGLPKETAKS